MSEIFPAATSYHGLRRPTMLIIHGTECDDAMSRAILGGQTEHQASAHYYIDDKGNVVQYLDETARAWHAGQGWWSGITDLNSVSVGIELLALSKNRTFTGPDTVYTAAQMTALTALAKQIIGRHQIHPWHVLAHQDVSCTRETEPLPLDQEQIHPFGQQKKYDPGPHFKWRQLAANGVGIWHDLPPVTNDPLVHNDGDFRLKLAAYGYDTSKEWPSVIRAFQTHFLPWHICGQVTEQSVQILDILLKKKFS